MKDEERNTSADAVDFVRDAERPADERHDDEDTPCRQSLPFSSEASDDPEPGPDRKVQPPVRAKE